MPEKYNNKLTKILGEVSGMREGESVNVKGRLMIALSTDLMVSFSTGKLDLESVRSRWYPLVDVGDELSFARSSEGYTVYTGTGNRGRIKLVTDGNWEFVEANPNHSVCIMTPFLRTTITNLNGVYGEAWIYAV